MAKVLVIDSNPEHRRGLAGLFRYRTSHTMVAAESCVEGVRACISERPDLVMINVLLFLADGFAFPRAMSRNVRTAAIPIVVQSSGPLGEVLQRQVEVCGVQGVVELPVSAGELNGEIEAALRRRVVPAASEGTVKPVQWPQAEGSGGEADKKAVRPVDWRALAKQSGKKAPEARTSGKSGTGGKASPNRGGAGRAGTPASNAGFRASAFEEVDPDGVKANQEKKGPKRFRRMEWQRVDPDPGKTGNSKQGGGHAGGRSVPEDEI